MNAQFIGNKNVEIKIKSTQHLSEKPSSGTLKSKIFESQNILKSMGVPFWFLHLNCSDFQTSN